MRKHIFILACLGLLLLAGSARADTYYVDTVGVEKDTVANGNWDTYPCPGFPPECPVWVNAIGGIGLDTDSNAYCNVLDQLQLFYFNSADSSDQGTILDTVIVQLYARYVSGSAGTSVIWYGAFFYTEGSWQYPSVADTTDELTTDYVVYQIKYTLNPWLGIGLSWLYFYRGVAGSTYGWGVYSKRVRSGVPVGRYNDIASAMLILKSHTPGEEQPSGQVIIIGARSEETHNPRACSGVFDSRW